MRLNILGGSAADPPGREGLADFTVNLCRRGTQRMSADQLNEAVEFVGASLGVGAAEDYITVALSTPAEHLADMMDILAQVVAEPSFPEDEFLSAQQRTLAQLANDLDDPGHLADRAITRALWGDHPYGHDVGGWARAVRSFTLAEVRAFHRQRFGPRAALLSVVGAVDPEQVAELAERSFARWTGGPEAGPEVPARQRSDRAGRVIVVDKPDQTQTQVRIGAMAFPKSHPDYLPSSVVNAVLGGGFTSRLVDEIRVNRGLSYGASSYFDPLRRAGSFHVSTFTKTGSTREVLDVALREVEKMRKKGPTPAELSKARTYLCGLFPLRLEANEPLAGGILDMRIHALGDDWLSRYRGRVMAVSPGEASELAARWFLPEGDQTIALVGRAEEVARQARGLGEIQVWKAADLE
jgi:zinc protease